MDGRRLVAWNLRRHRVERGLSQEKLAVDAQIDRTYVSSLERGLENPTVSVLDKLAAALSISIADFFSSTVTRRATSKAAIRRTSNEIDIAV
ncbi:helix-turn-helix transcriptional regulator [Bradyrhizobium sp. AS23.2]|uniref:helix-turn-helix domain-containing protein n=1 Tax=Bradyrhizobium sp. AS23.2 TaxID=1680155 RepID=UPI0032DE74E1